MATIGELVVNFAANSQKFEQGAGRVQKRVASLKSLALKAAGPIAAVFGGKIATDAARTQLEAERKLEAVLKSTGQAAGLSAQQIKDYASELQGMTNFGDEATIGAAAMLATFKEVKGDAFKDALAISQDMATVLGTDMKSSIIQVGKALNDPAGQMSALSRSGVSFTEAQKEQVKTLQAQGDLLGAQRIILGELQSEFGGAAAAVADPWIQIQNAIGDVGEQVGFVIMDFLKAATGAADITGAIGKLGEAVAAVRPLAVSVGKAFAWVFSTITSALLRGGTVSEAIDGLINLIERMIRGIRRLSFVAQALKTGHVFDLRQEVVRLDRIDQQQKQRAEEQEKRRKMFVGPMPPAEKKPGEGFFDIGAMFRMQDMKAKKAEAVVGKIAGVVQMIPEEINTGLGKAGEFAGQLVSEQGDEKQFAGALQQGSQEAYSAIIRAVQPRSQERAIQQTANATAGTERHVERLAQQLGSFFQQGNVINGFS